MSVTASFRTTPDKKTRVSELARRMNMSESYCYNLMLDAFLDELEDLEETKSVSSAIDEGRERTYTLEEVRNTLGL